MMPGKVYQTNITGKLHTCGNGRDHAETSLGQVKLDFKTGAPTVHPEPQILFISASSGPRPTRCSSLGLDAATTSLASHENLSGNCFTKAIVNVSAMT
jgi:hypothetical protein